MVSSRPKTDGDQEERGEVGRGDHAKDPQDDGEGEPSEREHRAEELEHREVRHRDQADPAVARVEEHPLMSAEPFPEPSLPSAALAAERRELLGHLGPADRIRDEGDAVRLASVAQVAVEAESRSKSSPTVSVQYPPTVSSSDRWNSPKAPEMMPSVPRLHPAERRGTP